VVERLLNDTDLSESTVCAVLAQNAGIDAIDLAQMTIDPEVAGAIPDEMARRYKVIPVGDDGLHLPVAVGDPYDFETMDSLPHVLGRELNFVCAPIDAVDFFLREFYGLTDTPGMNISGGHDVEASDGDAPIIRMVQNILADAMKNRCSDIHIEPLETS